MGKTHENKVFDPEFFEEYGIGGKSTTVISLLTKEDISKREKEIIEKLKKPRGRIVSGENNFNLGREFR
ncbi:MAG: hypothetical protein IIA87_03225 [Nanoarchaeota archaeon]|nr:hypothetical protein [Nanoarchaeota archaeon]